MSSRCHQVFTMPSGVYVVQACPYNPSPTVHGSFELHLVAREQPFLQSCVIVLHRRYCSCSRCCCTAAATPAVGAPNLLPPAAAAPYSSCCCPRIHCWCPNPLLASATAFLGSWCSFALFRVPILLYVGGCLLSGCPPL